MTEPERPSPDDVPDDAFDAIVAGWESDAAAPTEESIDAPPLGGDALELDVTVPDDLSSLFDEPAQRSIGLIVTGLADPDAALALSVIAQLSAGVFATEAGAVIVPDDVSAGAMSAAAEALGAAFAQADLLVVRSAGGTVTGARWRGGVEVEAVPVALLLGALPSVVESLILGTTSMDDVPDVRRTDGISRMRALKLLADAMRRGRRKRPR